MFSTNCSKICCSFPQNKIFEKAKMAAKIGKHFCDTTVAIATVLN